MAHPHTSLLREYKYAIDHLVPSVPAHVKEEALKMYEALKANEAASEDQILDALVKTGKAEYPHRHAYHALTKTMADEKRKAMVIEHVEPSVADKMKKLLESGASLDEVVRSKMFEEQFSPEERYQVQDGILDADEHMKEELAATVEKEREKYEALVQEKEVQMAEIQKQIDRLKELANKDPKWKDEILDKARLFESGWAVTERDPELETVKKEIEYWRGTLGEEVSVE
jgi:hypothetical protein